MKKVLFIAFGLLVMFSMVMAEEIPITFRPDITHSGPHRSPSNIVLTADYDEAESLLTFVYSIPNTSFSYSIYDEDENIVSEGTTAFDEDGSYEVLLGTLPSGSYQIEVVINSATYVGTLVIE
ncbi:MAG: hypothetical protein IJP70_05500 [Bacteroidales bacterium]|nr:hypothetical protein [Bacteroidales bacterium]